MEGVNKVELPLKYKELSDEETEELKKYFDIHFSKPICLGAKDYFFNKEFYSIVQDICNLPVRCSDVFVVSFPRSGTTLTQELVWLLQNDCDFERAKATHLTQRFSFLESGGFIKMVEEQNVQIPGTEKLFEEDFLSDPKLLNNFPSPRFIKCHLPMSLLPPSLLDISKVVYVAREPRDVAVSNYFHFLSYPMMDKNKNFKQFWKYFIQNNVLYTPFFEHVKEAWKMRHHPNMAFIFYEELLKDLPAVARRLATFFGKTYSDDTYQALCEHLKFDNFKKNDAVNMQQWRNAKIMTGNFIRKGKAGGWREHFDEEMSAQADDWIAHNLRDTDLRFPI